MAIKRYLQIVKALVPAAPYVTFTERFPNELEKLLCSLNVPRDKINLELLQLSPLIISKPNNRSLSGSLTQYAKDLKYYTHLKCFDHTDYLNTSLKLFDRPSLVMDAVFPSEVLRKLFGGDK